MRTAQSTVSHHLKILAEVRFVLVTPEGNANLYQINQKCLTCFPTAADVVMGLPAHRLVAERDGRVLGWVAVSKVSGRPAYAGVVEYSVYVEPDAHGQGIGSALLRALIASTEAAGIWTIQSGIFTDNSASLARHARHGFRIVGVRQRPGRLHGVWRDVIAIERRSTVVGI